MKQLFNISKFKLPAWSTWHHTKVACGFLAAICCNPQETVTVASKLISSSNWFTTLEMALLVW
jgi:hypothetical protein